MQYILDRDNRVFAIHDEDQRVLELYGEDYTNIFTPAAADCGDTLTPGTVELSPAKLSKRKLISYLAGFGMWEAVRGMIEAAGMMDLWQATNLIDFADPDFQGFLGGFADTAAQIGLDMGDMINNCRYYRD